MKDLLKLLRLVLTALAYLISVLRYLDLFDNVNNSTVHGNDFLGNEDVAHSHFKLCMCVYVSTTHVKTRTLFQTCKQVVTRLSSNRCEEAFTLLVPSCCVKSGTSC